MLFLDTLKPHLHVIACAGLIATSAHANTALEFASTNDYVAYDYDFDRKAETVATNPFKQICGFTAEEALIQSSDAYKGPSIYGGYQISSSLNKGAFSRQQIRDRKDKADAITLQSYSGESWEGSDVALHAVFFFKQADFTAPYNQGAFQPGSISAKWSSYFRGQKRDITGRYLIELNGTYYLSEHAFNMTNSGSNTLSKYIIGNTLWAVYDPGTDINFDQTSANFTKQSLDEVTAVGIYIEDDSWITDGAVSSPYALSIYGFEVTASN